MKSYYLIFSILIIPSVVFLQPESIILSQYANEFQGSAITEINQVIWPSLAYPTTTTNGTKLEIRFRSNLLMEPVEVRIFNHFLDYTVPIMYTNNTESVNEHISIINLPENILPFLYSFEVVYSNGDKLESMNSLLIRKSDSFELDQPYSFIQISDIHVDGSEQRYQRITKLITEINLINPDFVILTGDFVDGLTTDEYGGMVTAATQYPQGINLLKMLKIPILIINGNHDFQTNQWQDGNHLWEHYLGPLDRLVIFSYNNDTFVGANLLNENGLTADQLTKIDEAFENSTELRIFFAHTDYKNQFPSLYARNDIDLALQGHTHSSSLNTVSETIEVISDNSITLIDSEPGHYRLFSVSKSKEIETQELEVDKLISSSVWEQRTESTLRINISLKNYHDIPFVNITKRLVIPGDWSENTITGAVENRLLFNGSHTLLITQFNLNANTESNYSLILTSSPSLNEWISSTLPIDIVENPTGTYNPANSTSTKVNAGISLLEMLIFTLSSLFLYRTFKRK